MFFEIIWFIMIGLSVAFLAQILITPWSRTESPLGIFLTAVLGALLIGLFVPMDGFFLAPFLFWGTLLMSLLGSLLFVWLVGLIIYLLTPEVK